MAIFIKKTGIFRGGFFAGLRGLPVHENLTLIRRIFCPVVVSRCSVRSETDGCQNVALILCVIIISSAGQVNGQRFEETDDRPVESPYSDDFRLFDEVH